MNRIDAIGEACPIPVVRTKKVLGEMGEGTLEVAVDNEIAVANIKRLAGSLGYGFSSRKEDEGRYVITIEKTGGEPRFEKPVHPANGKTLVVISSNVMGSGDDVLGKNLLKGFIYALTQLEALPDAILFYNGGAVLTTEGSASLTDLRELEASGVEILTCGACLKHYGLEDKLMVGGATNMYAIVEAMSKAGRILRP